LYINANGLVVTNIQLIDLTGKIVFAANVHVQHGSVDLKGIAKGMYLVKIHADNYIVTKKISVK
jgi:lipopolysaccharide export system protein LptA